MSALMDNYARFPVEFVRGEGARLWDAEGEEYLDFLAGISVCNTGHCHPDVVAAIRAQAGQLIHVSNLFMTRPMADLAERLSASSLGGKVLFGNSGAEANEAALKVVRKAKPGGDIVVVHGAFHGRTYGALSATPQESKQAPFAPLVPGFIPVAPDPEALRRRGDRPHRRGPARADPGRVRRARAPGGAAARRPRRVRPRRRRARLRRGPDRVWAAPAPCGRTSGPASCPTR